MMMELSFMRNLRLQEIGKRFKGKYLRLIGKNSEGRRYGKRWKSEDLYGLGKWLDQDANSDLISFTQPEVGQYHIIISLNPERANEAEAHWDLWERSIKGNDGIRGISLQTLSDAEKPSHLAFPEGRAIAILPNS